MLHEVDAGVDVVADATSVAANSTNDVARLVRRYGGSVSTALLDPTCSLFRVGGIDGAIGYRQRLGCAVAIGDPVCAEEDSPRLASAFRAHCEERGWRTAFAVASHRFSRWAIANDYAAIAFGEELFFDPRRDPAAGAPGREVRKKLARARREGVRVREYAPLVDGRDHALEAAMEDLVRVWLAERRGLQMYVAPIDLFGFLDGRRWFYTRHLERVSGVLTAVQLDAIGDSMLDHHLVAADAPIGTSESLVVTALHRLGAESSRWVSFGPAPARELGEIHGLGRLSEHIARFVFRAASNALELDSRNRYRRKFQVARTEPAYLLVSPRRIGLREAAGFMNAFHFSFA